MPYCSQCGVEVEEDVKKCPLCQTPIQKILPDGQVGPSGPYPSEAAGSPPVPPLTMGEKMAIARTITTIGILIPLLLIAAIDYFINRRITWSSYVIASLTGAWFITLISLFSWKRPYVFTALVHLDILALIYIIGLIAGNHSWAIPVALPILTGSTLIVSAAVNRIRSLKDKGANVAGIILLAIAFLCAVIDFILQAHYHSSHRLGWSLIVLSVLIPTALLLFYVQSPRFSHSRLRKFLHF
ncbi:MAG: DUF6320 domain-containing protein [Spirochaetales bacterium]|nr:DUF6320 domain-containing protein [Spirochaetales bacterium]